ncbi:MAG TPA: LemA family protein [Nitrososphaera sp.]
MDAIISTSLSIIIPLLVVIGFFIYFISSLNRLRSLSNASEATLSQVRVAMKKRLDMIEQLVDLSKEYAKFEQETLEKITGMRANVTIANPKEIKNIDDTSRSILGNVVAVAESYPELKTSQTVTMIMNSVKDVEDEIARQRYTYNNIIQEYNTMLDNIPSNYIGRSAGMTKKEYLEYVDFWDEKLRRPTTTSSSSSTTTSSNAAERGLE